MLQLNHNTWFIKLISELWWLTPCKRQRIYRGSPYFVIPKCNVLLCFCYYYFLSKVILFTINLLTNEREQTKERVWWDSNTWSCASGRILPCTSGMDRRHCSVVLPTNRGRCGDDWDGDVLVWPNLLLVWFGFKMEFLWVFYPEDNGACQIWFQIPHPVKIIFLQFPELGRKANGENFH